MTHTLELNEEERRLLLRLLQGQANACASVEKRFAGTDWAWFGEGSAEDARARWAEEGRTVAGLLARL